MPLARGAPVTTGDGAPPRGGRRRLADRSANTGLGKALSGVGREGLFLSVFD
jgi:hypothetical protein